MDSIIKPPAFGIVLSLLAYLLGIWINKKTKIPILNPLLTSSALIILFLLVTNISYEYYNIGGSYITFFIAPSTIALVVNLYRNIDLLRKNLLAIFVGVLSGVVTAIISVLLLSKIFGLNVELQNSLVPKSLTTAIGVAISKEFGGIEALTVFSIIVTGISGAVMSPFVFKVFGIKSRVAKGIGLGTASHAVGTSKALEIGELEGGMSGLSIALAGFISVILIPIILNFFG